MEPSEENISSQPESPDEPTSAMAPEGEEVRRVTYGLLTSPSRSGGKRVRNGVFTRLKEFVYAMLAERR